MIVEGQIIFYFCNMSNEGLRGEYVFLPENLYVEDIRGLVTFGWELRGMQVMLQLGISGTKF